MTAAARSGLPEGQVATEDSGLPSVEKPVYVSGEASSMAGGVGLAMAAEPRKCRASLRRLRHRSGGIGQGPWARGPKMWTGLFSRDQARALGQGAQDVDGPGIKEMQMIVDVMIGIPTASVYRALWIPSKCFGPLWGVPSRLLRSLGSSTSWFSPSVVTYGVAGKSRPAAGIAGALRAATLAAAKEEVMEQESPVPVTGVVEPLTD